MHPTCIVVADVARARMLALRPERDPAAIARGTDKRIEEHSALYNAERGVAEHELFSAPRSDKVGRVYGRGHGRVYTIDDNRSRQEQEHDRKFAAQILDEGARLAHEIGAARMILVAEPKMLGLLRSESRRRHDSKLTLGELPKDLTKLPAKKICEHLEKDALLD